MLAQWHPEAEAKVSHNLRLRDEESAEALSATLNAICEKQVRGRSDLLRFCDKIHSAEAHGQQAGPDSLFAQAAHCYSWPTLLSRIM